MTAEEAGVPRVYLDTNAFIGFVESEGHRYARLHPLFMAIDDGRVQGVTSELTIAEVMVKPLLDHETIVASVYEEMLGGAWRIEALAVSRAVLLESARLRAADRSLRLPDAVHMATSRLSRCDHVVTSDRRLATTNGPLPLNPDSPADIARFLAALP